ncbi:hypothetical protein CPLU01_12017 [Colletotrichum plurivorum]|uniref:Uncharacterized protein n=1 Tax=Colletotrichum plurivorum TaxID=2175906 RepID=A0A8H6K0F7_9PEZI|nr:hypothetical protein CPLU01_12017 [Colletotrichum plurivorum]
MAGEKSHSAGKALHQGQALRSSSDDDASRPRSAFVAVLMHGQHLNNLVLPPDERAQQPLNWICANRQLIATGNGGSAAASRDGVRLLVLTQ